MVQQSGDNNPLEIGNKIPLINKEISNLVRVMHSVLKIPDENNFKP